MSLIAFMMMSGTITAPARSAPPAPASVHEFTMKDINGRDVPLAHYKGKVMLIVNVASRCGYTPQYADLEQLHRTYRDRGLAILGFPANNFGSQEPGTDAEIKTFCTTTYDVTFDMFSKISVKGKDQHPLYAWLTAGGGDKDLAGSVKWNFTKYLVDRNGRVIAKFGSGVKPMSEELVKAVEDALK